MLRNKYLVTRNQNFRYAQKLSKIDFYLHQYYIINNVST